MSNDTQRAILMSLENYSALKLAKMKGELSTEQSFEQFLEKYCIELPKQTD